MLATIRTLPHYFPEIFVQRVIFSILILLILCIMLLVACKKKRINKRQFVCSLLLSLYVVIVLYFTVIGRYSSDIYANEIYYFYSYIQLFDNFNAENVKQILINLCMLIPVGLLLPIVITGKKRFLWTMLISLFITLSIEIMQIVMVCGTFELDDIINNMLGAMFGMILSSFLTKYIDKRKKYHKRQTEE